MPESDTVAVVQAPVAETRNPEPPYLWLAFAVAAVFATCRFPQAVPRDVIPSIGAGLHYAQLAVARLMRKRNEDETRCLVGLRCRRLAILDVTKVRKVQRLMTELGQAAGERDPQRRTMLSQNIRRTVTAISDDEITDRVPELWDRMANASDDLYRMFDAIETAIELRRSYASHQAYPAHVEGLEQSGLIYERVGQGFVLRGRQVDNDRAVLVATEGQQ